MLFAMVLGVVLLATDQVDIREPRQRLVLNAGELQRLCATRGSHIFACTLFPEEKLECHCQEREGLWYHQMTAHLSPEMLLSLPRDASHEWLHLNDLRLRLGSWIGNETALGYASARDCQLAAQARVAGFPELMNGFRRASNEQYH